MVNNITIGGTDGGSAVASMTQLRVICGNYDTATGTATKTAPGAQTLLADMAEIVLGQSFWWNGNTIIIPAFPQATLGYYIKIVGDLSDLPEIPGLFALPDVTYDVTVYSGTTQQTVILASMFQAEVVFIADGTQGSYIYSPIPIFAVVFVRGSDTGDGG